MRGEQAIFNLEIKKKSGLSINPDIHHYKVFSSGLNTQIYRSIKTFIYIYLCDLFIWPKYFFGGEWLVEIEFFNFSLNKC